MERAGGRPGMGGGDIKPVARVSKAALFEGNWAISLAPYGVRRAVRYSQRSLNQENAQAKGNIS
jgi:hypothetical protein